MIFLWGFFDVCGVGGFWFFVFFLERTWVCGFFFFFCLVVDASRHFGKEIWSFLLGLFGLVEMGVGLVVLFVLLVGREREVLRGFLFLICAL